MSGDEGGEPSAEELVGKDELDEDDEMEPIGDDLIGEEDDGGP